MGLPGRLPLGYGSGLRASEVASLTIDAIDSARGVLLVRRGKGDKDRRTLLPDSLLCELRAWWRAARPPGPWLFPGRSDAGPYASPRADRGRSRSRRCG